MKLYCAKCNHEWLSRVDAPRECPNCKSRGWNSQPREMARAHAAVRQAVLDGSMFKPSVCSRCGSSKSIVAHHADYAKPLEVEWLCHKCHKKHHAAFGSGANLGLPTEHGKRCTCRPCTAGRKGITLDFPGSCLTAVRLPDDLSAEVDRLALQEGRSRSQIIVRALTSALLPAAPGRPITAPKTPDPEIVTQAGPRCPRHRDFLWSECRRIACVQDYQQWMDREKGEK